MRTIVVGDIHGNNFLFRKALKSIHLKKTDCLIILGDLIDRGPDSKGVLDTILLLKQNGFDNIRCLRGNHEQMLIDSYYDENKEYIWIKNGGDYTLKSFKVNFANQIPKEYIELIETFPNYVILDNFIFVHAGLNLHAENPFKDYYSMMWIRNMSEKEFEVSTLNKFTIIHGHTPLNKDDIQNSFFNRKIKCLDNGVFINQEGFGSLVIADLENNIIKFIR